MMTKRVIIVIGPARAGTHYYASELAKLNNAKYVGECRALWEQNLYSPNGREKIKRYFNKTVRAQTIVEKTPSNSLRCDDLIKFFPEYHFQAVIRHPIDCMASTIKKMNGNVAKVSEDGTHQNILSKLSKVLSHKLELYGKGFAYDQLNSDLHLLSKKFSGNYIWGPQYKGIERDLLTCNLHEIAAKQWLYAAKSMIESFELSKINRLEDMLSSGNVSISGVLVSSKVLSSKASNNILERLSKKTLNELNTTASAFRYVL